jgi:hypothetical protein
MTMVERMSLGSGVVDSLHRSITVGSTVPPVANLMFCGTLPLSDTH